MFGHKPGLARYHCCMLKPHNSWIILQCIPLETTLTVLRCAYSNYMIAPGFDAQAGKKAKQKDSDDEEEEDFEDPEQKEEAAAQAAAAREPARLAGLRPAPYASRDQEHCDVCGSAEGWDG